MKRDQMIATLRDHERELHRCGVLHAALFGSVARGEEKPGSQGRDAAPHLGEVVMAERPIQPPGAGCARAAAAPHLRYSCPPHL